MESTSPTEVRRRVDERIAAWRIVVERLVETEGSILAFGRRGTQAVVLKVIRHHREERLAPTTPLPLVICLSETIFAAIPAAPLRSFTGPSGRWRERCRGFAITDLGAAYGPGHQSEWP